MSAVLELRPPTEALPAERYNRTAEVVAHAKAVQEVMKAVMKPGVHYGVIPGAGDKPTLFKSGAEVLCMTFRIADSYRVTDLSTPGSIRYRVECVGAHQDTGLVLGSGMGECSTDEEKYKWRKVVCDEEFDATPDNLRRIKFGRDRRGGHYVVKQIKTDAADLANTALKMACKRAKIAMVLNVTAASDMFSQDLEDLDAELVRHLTEDERIAQLQMVRDQWITKAHAAADRETLGKTLKEGVKVFQSSRDKDGYAAFAKAVQDRGAQLRKEGQQ